MSYPDLSNGSRPENRIFLLPGLPRSAADAKFVPDVEQIMGVGGRPFKPHPDRPL